jgi:thymidine phosphorylase
MAQPLGDAVGNALDVVEAVQVLRGEHRGRLRELAVAFAAHGAQIALGIDLERAMESAERALDDGSALDRFGAMVGAQGGDRRVIDDPGHVLPSAPVVLAIEADRSGTVAAMATEDIGLASGALGAGRVRKGDPIDPAVGIVVRCKIGDELAVGQPIGQVHARDADAAHEAARRVLGALTLQEGDVVAPPLVHAWLD